MPSTIAIAGASGFVGRHLCQQLADQGHRVLALSRSGRPPIVHPLVEGRPCDLFSLLDAERAVDGADQAVYLVHSMLPSARLTQASFEDMDLVLADNFARACKRAQVKHTVYLGGIVPQLPDDDDLSTHLASRREVEVALAAYGMRVTTLRAGLVIGPHGSSFRIVTRLVKRLPTMLGPAWTRTPTQPIALRDVVDIISRTLTTPGAQGGTHDIASPDVVTYTELMQRTAEHMLGRRPKIRPVPVLTPKLSALWVSLVTSTPMELIKPLIQSLSHPMLASDLTHQQRLGVPGLNLDEAIAEALEGERQTAGKKKPAKPRKKPPAAPEGPPDVRSIQRLPFVHRSAAWVADEYLRWLPEGMRPFIKVEVSGPVARFFVRGVSRPLLQLELSEERSTPDRTLLYITGGLLARTGGRRGRLEFRSLPESDCVIAAIHDFEPRLPWFIYKLTQAPAHLWVMWRFARHLARLSPPNEAAARAA